jgi:hypothetical protein
MHSPWFGRAQAAKPKGFTCKRALSITAFLAVKFFLTDCGNAQGIETMVSLSRK